LIKIKKSGGLSDCSFIKRRTENGFADVTVGKRKTADGWVNILSESGGSGGGGGGGGTPSAPVTTTYTKTYALTSAQTYWNSGGKDTQYPSELIQGSYGNSSATARRSLLFFGLSQIRADLAGGVIKKVEIYLDRYNSAHGSETAYLAIRQHNYSSAPTRWDSGSDYDTALSGSAKLMRSGTSGEAKWITLKNAVGENLRDGRICGISLNAQSNYSLSYYCRLVKSGTKLRITYSKTV
jgi:hypothetical protein